MSNTLFRIIMFRIPSMVKKDFPFKVELDNTPFTNRDVRKVWLYDSGIEGWHTPKDEFPYDNKCCYMFKREEDMTVFLLKWA